MSSNKGLRVATAVLVIASLASSLACSGAIRQAAQKQKEQNDLKMIGLDYHNYNDVNSKAPATLKEFTDFMQKNSGGSPLLTDLQSGKYVIYLDVQISKLPAGSNNTVLGYESAVPVSGGPVLMADASTKIMTAAEFAAAAKPPPPAKPSKP